MIVASDRLEGFIDWMLDVLELKGVDIDEFRELYEDLLLEIEEDDTSNFE